MKNIDPSKLFNTDRNTYELSIRILL